MEHHRRSEVEQIFRRHGGMMRTSEAIHAGINSGTIYTLHQMGVLDRVNWGLYSLADYQVPDEPDFVIVAKQVPRGIVCLLSAVVFHKLTTQMPDEIYVMLDRRSKRPPKFDYPPVHFVSCSSHLFNIGVDTHTMGSIDVRITNPERTIADCFKHRNRVGIDVAIEALRNYCNRQDPKPNLDLLMQYARVCRIEKVMQPYLETVING